MPLCLRLLPNRCFAADEYAVCDSIIMSATRGCDDARIFAFGKHDGLSLGAGLIEDRIEKSHDGDLEIT